MKKTFFLVFLSLAFLCAGPAYAQEKTIKLRDGTALKGEILSKEAGTYRIRTKTLGILFIKDTEIQNIEEAASGGALPAAPASMASSADVQALQQKVMGNPQLMGSIQSLTQNKEVVDILNDAEIRDAVMRRDVEYLKNNEKFMEFTNNPSVKRVIDELAASLIQEEQ